MAKRTNQNTVLKAMKEYIETCPYLDKFNGAFPIVDVEDVADKPVNYMVETVPLEPYLRKYLDGTGIKQAAFVFASRELSGDTDTKLDNNGFYEDFSRWIERNERNRVYPILNPNQDVLEIKVTLSSYVFDETSTTKQYQIQLYLKWYETLAEEEEN